MNATVFFDLETGGLDPGAPDIQLAAVAVDDQFNELATFERKIQFVEITADVEALQLVRWDREVWKAEALPEADVVNAFSDFLMPFRSLSMVSKRTGNPYSVARLAGHNADRFDGPRLMAMFARNGSKFLPADPRVRCTCQRALWWFDEHGVAPPGSFKLATLCAYFEIDGVDVAHDALADVRMSVALAQRLRRGP